MVWRERKFLTSTLVAAAGCKAVTFRAWRNRNGLFPQTKDNGGWNHFSIVDICVARVVVVMTQHGIPADDAIWLAERIQRSNISRILEGNASTHLQGFFAGSVRGQDERPDWVEARCTFIGMGADDKVGPLLKATKGILTIVDLHPIIEHVLTELVSLQPELMATAKETHRLIFSTFADAIRPAPSDSEGGA